MNDLILSQNGFVDNGLKTLIVSLFFFFLGFISKILSGKEKSAENISDHLLNSTTRMLKIQSKGFYIIGCIALCFAIYHFSKYLFN